MDKRLWQVYSVCIDREKKSRRLVGMGRVAITSSRLLCRDSRNLLREARHSCDRAKHIITAHHLIG